MISNFLYLLGTKSRAKADAESVASGYDLTIGTTEALCTNFLAPHLKDDHRICVSQEFGTVPVLVVGKVSSQYDFRCYFDDVSKQYALDENYAFFHGTEK